MRDFLVVGALFALTTALICALCSQGCRLTEQHEETQDVHLEELK